jgi:DNA topoisomerase-2
MYVPEMIFGHLLTGSNFDDNQDKVTGGRNGLGAKLTNIYSTEFIVETASTKYGKKFKQVYSNNMANRSKPSITSFEGKDYTKFTFKPDLTRFEMETLEDDMIEMMKKRVYDVAGCNSSLKVWLNGKRIPMKNFQDYVKLYFRSSMLEGKAMPSLVRFLI